MTDTGQGLLLTLAHNAPVGENDLLYMPLRAGSDIAFLGGLINYILSRDLWFKDYVLNYINLSTIIENDFKDTSELGQHRHPHTLQHAARLSAPAARPEATPNV